MALITQGTTLDRRETDSLIGSDMVHGTAVYPAVEAESILINEGPR
jgi:hypothetical protein